MYNLLPPKAAAKYFRHQLLRDRAFRRFYDHYEDQGFEFYPERVQLAVGLPSLEGGKETPFTLAIVPSFRPFHPRDDSHEAVSIVALRAGRVNTVLAGEVTVRHRPYEVGSFRVNELNGEELEVKTFEREEVAERAPEEALELVPLPEADTSRVSEEVDGLPDEEVGELAGDVFRAILRDDYARPLYPPGGFANLLADEPLVQRFAAVTHARFDQIAEATKACCSTSTSSNACSSTSCSCFEF